MLSAHTHTHTHISKLKHSLFFFPPELVMLNFCVGEVGWCALSGLFFVSFESKWKGKSKQGFGYERMTFLVKNLSLFNFRGE